jgi:predicted nucleotidyltransferase
MVVLKHYGFSQRLIMNLDEFDAELHSNNDEESIIDFCRKHVLHGTPYIFRSRDEEFYEFRKRIADKFSIPFHEIYITGSAKLGFSPHKKKPFDYDSDIDVALVSPSLFEKIMSSISEYQMMIRKNRAVVRLREIEMYHSFLEYVALGWIRPDKLPVSFQMQAIKDDWFEFFRSISNGSSEVGNFKVNAGVFKSYQHLEAYTLSGIKDIKKSQGLRNS